MYELDPNLLLSFSQLDHTYTTLGVFGVLALVVTMLVNLYKIPALQDKLPDNFKWTKLPHLEQIALVFGSSVLVSALTAVAAHMSVSQALSVGVSTGLAALGLNETTTAVGKAHASVAIATNPNYVPGVTRKIVAAVVPVDTKAVEKAQTKYLFSQPIENPYANQRPATEEEAREACRQANLPQPGPPVSPTPNTVAPGAVSTDPTVAAPTTSSPS